MTGGGRLRSRRVLEVPRRAVSAWCLAIICRDAELRDIGGIEHMISGQREDMYDTQGSEAAMALHKCWICLWLGKDY